MMIVDNRTGSAELIPLLRRRGVEVEEGRLAYGDAQIIGNGPDGCPYPVGVEYKKISDVLSCITDGRFAGHQLPGLIQCYQVSWLLIEGSYRADMHSGQLQIKGGKGFWHNAHVGGRYFMYKDLSYWLMTMEMRGGVRVARTYDRTESVQWLADLYHWWTDKDFDKHRSHLNPHQGVEADRALLVRPSLVRRMACELPGIGWEKSGAVAAAFATPMDMAMASLADWMAIPGIGRTMALRILEALNG